MSRQSIEGASDLYNLPHWGAPYFKINGEGQLEVYPLAETAPPVVISSLIEEIKKRQLRFPVLVRFNDIIQHRLQMLQQSFVQAAEKLAYGATHQAVYPIKVNQQHSVIEEILRQPAQAVGLEAGSKPELMAVLAMAEKSRLIVCNGYKDREYIRLALMARKAGQNIIIVIEKFSELELVLQQAEKLNVQPVLGVRIRLSSMGKGKWQNSGGEKSKFGLSTAQLLQLIQRLQQHQSLDCLQLLHFHMGSQVSCLDDLRQGMVEAVRAYMALKKAGAPMGILDVGGGLAVDYEGTCSSHVYSMSYTLEDYAQMILQTVKQLCDEASVEHPRIITESGRAMVAHHAMLITDVIETERRIDESFSVPEETHPLIEQIQKLASALSLSSLDEEFREALDCRHQAQALFNQGRLSLQQRAAMDHVYYSLCRQMLRLIDPGHGRWNELNEILADKYFCNLSIFQSMPDVWGIEQIFPIMPLQRLDEKTERRAILYDLTCDSDGHIEYYADDQSIESTLPVHSIRPGEDYYLGIFLLGAYQEILGDMHNLFGDTDTVNVKFSGGAYSLQDEEWGDSADQLLEYVHFDITHMLAVYRHKITRADLSAEEKKQFMEAFEEGLYGYTYFEKN